MVQPHTSMGCVSPHCSFALPVPFPATHHVGPELLMLPVSNSVAPLFFFFLLFYQQTPQPFRTTFFPERFCPLPLLCNTSACHILPFTVGHPPAPCLSHSSQYSLKWAPYNTQASIYLRALLSFTLSLPPAHLFKANFWAVLKFGRDVFFPPFSSGCTYDGTMHGQ